MGEFSKDTSVNPHNLFPVKQKNGTVIYYVSDFSEELGNGSAADVYKGYRCSLKNPNAILRPSVINKDDIIIHEEAPVAFKLYKKGQTPSPYKIAQTPSAVFELQGRVVRIMEYIEGFHINPDIEDNPQIKTMTFFQAVDAAWQFVIALNQLHYRNTSGPAVVHGDIKGDNVKIRLVKEVVKSEGSPATEAVKIKLDVFYLDDDYTKPILPLPQIAQGTPEHFALEVLEGYYSEASDFYALGSLLLSLFGAKNPFKELLEFRDNHPLIGYEALIRRYAEIGFNTEGLFEHFSPKPDVSICKLLEKFIMHMVAKEKQHRPSPDAVLEFFTALRQWCLFSQKNEDVNVYHLRMMIAANDPDWLVNNTQRELFFSLDENIQSRLINIMSVQECRQLYQFSCKDNILSSTTTNTLVKILLDDLIKNSRFIKSSSFWSQSNSSVSQKALKWLLDCFENQDHEAFFSPQREDLRKTLTKCTQNEIAPLIATVIVQLTKAKEQMEIQHSNKLQNMDEMALKNEFS